MKHVSQLHVSSAPGAQLHVSCAPATLRHESYAATTSVGRRVFGRRVFWNDASYHLSLHDHVP